jgi:hypothetical protein
LPIGALVTKKLIFGACCGACAWAPLLATISNAVADANNEKRNAICIGDPPMLARAMLAQTYTRLVNRRDEVMTRVVMTCTVMTRVASLVAGDHVRDGGSRIPCCAGENHI